MMSDSKIDDYDDQDNTNNYDPLDLDFEKELKSPTSRKKNKKKKKKIKKTIKNLSNSLFLLSLLVLTVSIIIIGILNLIVSGSMDKRLTTLRDLSEKMLGAVGEDVNIEKKSEDAVPSLVVFVVVDQLRSDLVQKYRKRFEKDGGFNRLYENGMFMRNARYRHANTVTAVGHSTLFTGGNSASHGIVGNKWVDRKTGKLVYAPNDPNFEEVENKEKISGSAPTNLLSTTIGDEFKIFNSKSKVFAVSLKDRAAILPGGHLGKAFWFSRKTGNFISSTFYYDEYPEYVKEFNKERIVDDFKKKKWELKYPEDEYHHQDRTNILDYPFGKNFPKSYSNSNNFYNDLIRTPIADTITAEFAKKVLENENLGNNEKNIIDMLSVSFSGTDYIQHHNGVNSMEAEDMTYKLDEILGDFFDFIDEKVGLEKTLVVLSADHGVDLSWKKYQEMNFPVYENGALKSELNDVLNKIYGTNSIVSSYIFPNVYFNRNLISELNLDEEEIENHCIEYLNDREGVFYAFSRADIKNNRVPNLPIVQKLFRAYHPQRSGNVLIVPDLVKGSSSTLSSHGTPWNFDCYVPIFFWGMDIKSGVVSDTIVGPEDIAPTICNYFGFRPPTGCLGNPISEVLAEHNVNKNLL